jgi:uncharacterized protein involved in exopolysaccharide biosynthesis
MDELFTIRGILSTFFRQWRIFWLVFLCILAIGLLYLTITTPLYESSGSVLVKFGSDADAGVNKDNGKVPLPANDRREIIQSNIDIIQSHDLLRDAINKIGVERLYPGITERVGDKDSPLEAAISQFMRKHLVVKSSQQSNVIDISVLNPDPKVAAQMVDILQDVFIAKQLEIFNKPQTTFLSEQVKEAEERLNKSQQALKDFKSSIGITSIETELSELLKQKSTAAAVAFQSVADAQSKLADLRDQESEMLATYKSNSPALQAVRKSIAEAKRQLQERQKHLGSSSGSEYLEKQTSSIDKRIADLEGKRSQYNDLLRQVQIDESNYKNYLARQEEARINETLGEKKITSISVIDSPVVPNKPARPRKLLTLAATIMAGLMLGAGIAFLREITDARFRTPKQLAAVLKSPVLAAFPKKDGILQLFNNIEHLLANVPQPVIQFVSSYKGEGADNIARDLAELAKQQGKNVLLINNEQLRNNFQQVYVDFLKSHNNCWTIIPNSGILHDEVGQSMARLASGTVMVVEAERTRAPVAQEVQRLITLQGGKIIGGILVNRRFYIPSRIYNLLFNT